MKNSSITTEEKVKQKRPPYASPGLAEEALIIFKRVSPKKIDHNFVINNGLSTKSNAFRILDVYRWFGIIDVEGNVNQEKMAKLRMAGDEREKYIETLIKESYSNLFEEINLSEAKKDDIINYFIRNNSYTAIQANYATALFISFCQKYNIPLSEKLKTKINTANDKPLTERKRKVRTLNKDKQKEDANKVNEELMFEAKNGDNEEVIQIIVIKGKNKHFFEAPSKKKLENIKTKELPKLLEFLEMYLPEDDPQENITS